MVRQIGKPSIFFTFSRLSLAGCISHSLLTKNFEDIIEKRKLMHDNPILIGNFFQIIVYLFIEHILKKIFKVKDY